MESFTTAARLVADEGGISECLLEAEVCKLRVVSFIKLHIDVMFVRHCFYCFIPHLLHDLYHVF